MKRERQPIGFLVGGMVIGFSLGAILAKQDHFVPWLPIGAILGAIDGVCLERFNHGSDRHEATWPDSIRDSDT